MYYNLEGSQSHSALIIEANMKIQEKNLQMKSTLFVSEESPNNTTDTDESTNSTKGDNAGKSSDERRE